MGQPLVPLLGFRQRQAKLFNYLKTQGNCGKYVFLRRFHRVWCNPPLSAKNYENIAQAAIITIFSLAFTLLFQYAQRKSYNFERIGYMNAAWKIDQTKILSGPEIASVLTDLKRRAKRSVNSRMNLVIFRLATCCGLRVSEIAGLKLQDVRVGVDRPYLRLPKAITKGKRPRRVPLWWDSGTLDDLTGWKAERQSQGARSSDYFVCAMSKAAFGKKLDPRNLRYRFISSCRVLGKERQEDLTIHDGRHSFCSHALAGGRSLAEVRDAAGHANVSTTSVYTHIATDGDEPGDIFNFGCE